LERSLGHAPLGLALEDITLAEHCKEGVEGLFSRLGATNLGARSPLLHHLSRGFVFSLLICIFIVVEAFLY
jgi:hypothetical protein